MENAFAAGSFSEKLKVVGRRDQPQSSQNTEESGERSTCSDSGDSKYSQDSQGEDGQPRPNGCGSTLEAPAVDLALQAQIRELSNLVGNRKWHLRTYKNVCVGREVVDWAMSEFSLSSRDEAVAKGQSLINARLLHHVTDEHPFKDAHLFYRFYSDEPVKKRRSLSQSLKKRLSQCRPALRISRNDLEGALFACSPLDGKPVVVTNDTNFPAFVVFSSRKIIRAFNPLNVHDDRRSSAVFQCDSESHTPVRGYSYGDMSMSNISEADRESVTFCEREVAQVSKVRMEAGDFEEVDDDIVDNSIFYVQVQFLKRGGEHVLGWKCQAWSGAYKNLKLSKALPEDLKSVGCEMGRLSTDLSGHEL